MDKASLEIKSFQDIEKIYKLPKYFVTNLDKENFGVLYNQKAYIYNFIYFSELVYLCYLDFISLKLKSRTELLDDKVYFKEPHNNYELLYDFYQQRNLSELNIENKSVIGQSRITDPKNILNLLFIKNSILVLQKVVPDSFIQNLKNKITTLKLNSSLINEFLVNFINTL